jgi:hypothetical protein
MPDDENLEIPDLDSVALEPEIDTFTNISGNEQDTPPFASAEWQDYVMAQFRPDELADGKPTCDGLRRVAEALIGPSYERRVSQLIGPNNTNRFTSTVVLSLELKVTNPSHPLCGHCLLEEDVADCNEFNTDKPYCKYPSAVAATRAEARILRKLLRLKTVAAEETSDIADKDIPVDNISDMLTNWQPEDKITPEQIVCLDTVCKRADVNVLEFINSGEKNYDSIDGVSQETAQQMIQHANKVLQGKVDKPQGVGTYVKWR